MDRRTRGSLWTTLGVLAAMACAATGAAPDARFGVGTLLGLDEVHKDEKFESYELYAAAVLPWQKQWASGWWVNAKLTGGIGTLQDEEEDAWVFSFGPSLQLGHIRSPLFVEGGTRPTLITCDELGDPDLDGPFHFISHVAANALLSRHLGVGLRLQHMSNAGLYESNPGLNMLVLDLGWWF